MISIFLSVKLLALMLDPEKRCCCELYDKMLYPPLTFTERVSGGDFRWNKAPVSIGRCVIELKGGNRLACLLCPSFLLLLLGSFLSWALAATTDKKMINYHRPQSNSCSRLLCRLQKSFFGCFFFFFLTVLRYLFM